MFALKSAFSLKTPLQYINSAIDQYSANVSLLLHGEGTNGSSSNGSFIDNGNKNITPISVSNASITTSRFKFGSGSILLNSGYLRYTSNIPDFDLTAGNFTIEFWLYIPALPVSSESFCLVRHQTGSASNTDFDYSITLTSDGLLKGIVTSGTSAFEVFAPDNPTLNSWNHVAFVRNGNDLRMFLNGIPGANLAGPANGVINNLPTGTLTIGADLNNTNSSAVNFDEFRITKGIARYTQSFTIPTTAFPDSYADGNGIILGNELLIVGFEGANGSTTFTDSSNYAAPLSSGTGVVIQTPFGSTRPVPARGLSSVSYDGTVNAYVTTPKHPRYTLDSNSDWTVDFFVRVASGGLVQVANLFTNAVGVAGTWADINFAMFLYTNGRYRFGFPIDNGSGGLQAGATDIVGTVLNPTYWRHYAVVYNSTAKTLTTYINGVLDTSILANDTPTGRPWKMQYTTSQATRTTIGRYDPVMSTPNGAFKGNIDRFRITPGQRWTSAFTPDGNGPTVGSGSTIGTQGPGIAVTPTENFILAGDEPTGSTTIVDSSVNLISFSNNAGTSPPGAQVTNQSTTRRVGVGAYSMNGGYLLTGSSSKAYMGGASSWTFDCFINMSAMPVNSGPGTGYFQFAFCSTGTSNNWSTSHMLGLSIASSGQLSIDWSNGTTTTQTSGPIGTAMVAGTWYHIAVVWDSVGKTFKTYINGIADSTTSVTTFSSFSTTPRLTIGRTDPIVPGPLSTYTSNTAYLDRIRLTPSVRWTSNFIVD